MRLNQILGAEAQVKKTTDGIFEQTAHLLNAQQRQRFYGLTRTYQPNADDGDPLPDESVRVQARVDDTLSTLRIALIHLWDITATKDWANTKAKADLVVDGAVILVDVPATFLLWLSNRLASLEKLIRELPVLPEDKEWSTEPDGNGHYVTPGVKTLKTQKRHEVVSKAKATLQFAEQAEIIYTDQTIGKWTTVHRSGAVPLTRVRQLLERIWTLQQAVTVALHEANTQQVEEQHVGAKLLDWLMAP